MAHKRKTSSQKALKADDALFRDWRFETINTSTILPSDDDNLPLEWKFNTSETEYLDPRMFLKLEVKITKGNGTAIGWEVRTDFDPDKPAVGREGEAGYIPQGKKKARLYDSAGPINLLLMTMFKHVDIQVITDTY